MLRSFVLAAVAALLPVVAAFADSAPLTEDQAKRFVASLSAVEALGDELEAEGKTDQLDIETAPKAGEPFKPYSAAIAALSEKYPADHARLASAVKPHGFSADDWGAVGDRVIVAYMALKMEEEDPRAMEMMEGMDASMIEMMPPEMRDQMEAAFAMMETVKNAPADDKRIVSTVKDDLDAYMENEGGA